MLSLRKSLVSPQICNGYFLLFNRNFCSPNNPNNDVRLNYLTDDHKGIAVIELNRESGKNSFNRLMASTLHNYVDILSTDKNVRAVIIRSLVKGVFCAGADLKERKTLTPVEVQRFVNSLRSLIVKLENLPAPTIAAIDGAAMGGGLEMGLACDFRVASNQAKMGLVETRLAIIPGAGELNFIYLSFKIKISLF
jgi:methylglutaconyl-CoA hydratase